MKDERTYIKLFHNILDWGWYNDTNTFRVFLHILLRANYKDSEYKGVKIPAGACVFGYNAWAKELGLSVRQVRTAITHLKSTGEVTIKTTSKFSVVSLVKWEFWQIEEGRATSKTTSRATSKRQASDKQATTSKDSKNIYTTPTIDMVREYVAENKMIIDPDYFFRYYETAKWKDNKGKPIRNWKLKALNWNRREEERKNAGNRSDEVGDAKASEPSKGWDRIFGG